MNEHKKEIIATRKGYVGSSDARLLAQISLLGYVPKVAYRRMALIKGFVDVEDVSTPAMRFGDFIENAIYEHISATDTRYQSNPMWVSKKYSRKNVQCMSHPDIVLEDDTHKVLNVYEVKATKQSTEETRQTYKAQLFHHMLLAKERAEAMHYRVHVFLCHYNTNGVDLSEDFTFDTERLTITEVRFNSVVFNLHNAMDIVNDFLDDFNIYSEDESIDAALLPDNVHEKFVVVANLLREIKQRETAVNEFKTYLYNFLTEKGIKRISCDEFAFTVVQPTASTSVDYARIFGDEIESKHPKKAARLKAQYTKTTSRKGYVTIKVKSESDNK